MKLSLQTHEAPSYVIAAVLECPPVWVVLPFMLLLIDTIPLNK